jgi:abhydrolase domain-containing protein 6
MKKNILIAVLILIVAAVTFYYAFPEPIANYFINQERSKAGLVKKEIKAGDDNIVYLEGGKGPAVLLLHGFAADKDNWTRFAFFLTKDYHVIIPDIPGFGDSAKRINAKYDLVSQIERLHKFAQSVHISKFHIAGNSMGGLFAGAYAVHYPNEILSLGLFDAAGVRPPVKNDLMKLMEKGENPLLLKDENDLPRLLRLVFAEPPSLPYPFRKMFVRKSLANRSFNEKIIKEVAPDLLSLEKELPAIQAPTLVLWGDKDEIVDISSVSVFEKGLKNFKTVIIKNCGHVPMMEKPQETASGYLTFIKSINN